ncbi:hypothetical protein A3F66_06215 [candidate division TM6 bacterium RIFCSPHIGHO2_12_FULL_32_22]|nr:MAG: hypothetical protein A3F66_06215 [candidate division TM6 bacterium RIFCSPHIGHO2_12_FULL_32_22]
MIFNLRFLLLSLLLFNLYIYNEPVLIFTYAFNRPEFIELQHKCFKKFLKDDYEFIVFNDANTIENELAIENTCKELGIKCVRIPQIIHDLPYLPRWDHEPSFHYPTIRCVNGVQFSLNRLGFFHKGPLLILDSDMFLIREFSVKEVLKNYDIISIYQRGIGDNNCTVNYISIDLILMNMEKLPNKQTFNVNCGYHDGAPTDAAGQTYWYIKNNPTIRILYSNNYVISEDNIIVDYFKNHAGHKIYSLNMENLKNAEFSEKEIEYIMSGATNTEFVLNNCFHHYRSGSNWDGRPHEYHKNKFHLLKKFVENITQ